MGQMVRVWVRYFICTFYRPRVNPNKHGLTETCGRGGIGGVTRSRRVILPTQLWQRSVEGDFVHFGAGGEAGLETGRDDWVPV
jgi:hypothetical protein